VFALSFLGTNPSILDGGQIQDMTQQQRQESESAPLSSQQKQQDAEPHDERDSETGENVVTQEGRAEFAIRDNSVNCETEECLSFYIWGIVRDISSDSLTLVQSNQTESKDDNSITVAHIQGPRLLWCAGGVSGCSIITYDKVPLGTLACAHARLNPDGSFSIDTIFFNTGCATQIPPSSNN
jgi:hypothetical protein